VEYKTTTPHITSAFTERTIPSASRAVASNYTWKKKYGDLRMAELQRQKILEDENARLKRIVTALTPGWQQAVGGCPKNSLKVAQAPASW